MPIYEYCCEDCQQIFEEWQKDFQARDKVCPICGGNSQRIISNTTFVLKGGGWYESGYTKSPSGNNGNGDKKSSAPEATDSAPSGATDTAATDASTPAS